MEKGLNEALDVLTVWAGGVFAELSDLLSLALGTIIMPINFILGLFA